MKIIKAKTHKRALIYIYIGMSQTKSAKTGLMAKREINIMNEKAEYLARFYLNVKRLQRQK
jgi:hypothetical protein